MSEKIIIKKHKNRNKYYLTPHKQWVRDFTSNIKPEDINDLLPRSEYFLILNNEIENAKKRLAGIDSESIYAPNVIIVSDGFNFDKKQELLKSFTQDEVIVIGVNRSLAKWKMFHQMDYFLANNPYKECLKCIPNHNYYPRCIVSSWTCPEFVKKYQSRQEAIYKYDPVHNKKFSPRFSSSIYSIDDYRNPICAAIGLAYRWQVRKLLLLCCDDVFAEDRPGSVCLPNGKYMYPQHFVCHGLIDGCLHWLTRQEFMNVEVFNCSEGPEYKNAKYISEDADLKELITANGRFGR